MARAAQPTDLLRLHLAVAGFGFAGLFGKLLALPPVAIVAGRAGFAALGLALLLMLRPGLRGGTPPAGWLIAGLPGLLLAAHWWLFFQAVQVSTVAVAMVSFSAFPLLVILWEALEHRRAPAVPDLVASSLALLGVAVIAQRFDLSDAALRGALWGLASGVSFAAIILWNRRQVALTSPWGLAMVQDAVAALVLLPFILIKDVRPSPREWLLLVCLGVVLTAGTHGLFIRSLRSVPARTAGLACTLEPAYGIVAGMVVLGEVPPVRTVLGAVLVIAAVAFATVRDRRGPTDPAAWPGSGAPS